MGAATHRAVRPTAADRTLAWLRGQGYVACAVDDWYAPVDVIAIAPTALDRSLGFRLGGIHVCRATAIGRACRLVDLEADRLASWLRAPGGFEIHRWRYAGTRTGRGRWLLTRVVARLAPGRGVVFDTVRGEEMAA